MQADPYTDPEVAITCYERWSGLRITLHDLGGALGPHLAPSRQWHAEALCQTIKNGPHGHRCIRWEIDDLRPIIADQPAGAVRICHIGLVELVVPVVRHDRLELVLFAGPRGAGADLIGERDSVPTVLPARARQPPAMGRAEATQALEGLRQVAARLRLWLDEHAAAQHTLVRQPGAVDRALAIRRFIAAEHRRAIGLADLARHLGLSAHRTAHVVREQCGRTFVALLTEARLGSACALLRHTDLSVAAVATGSGFGDPDHFHRVFRHAIGTTPRRYRELAAGP